MGTKRDNFRDIDDRTDDLRDLAQQHGDIFSDFMRSYELSMIYHENAQPAAIASRITKLVEWAGENDPDDDDAVKFAAHFHHEFMSIFPFSEHTGKTGRLLLNYILLRHGYMPVVFHATERQRYYD